MLSKPNSKENCNVSDNLVKENRVVKVGASYGYLLWLLLSNGKYVYVNTERHLSTVDLDIFASKAGSFEQVYLEGGMVKWSAGAAIACELLLASCAPTSQEALASTMEDGRVEPLARTMAVLNNEFFLPQFTYPVTKFELVPGQMRELADHLVLVKGRGILFQLKERSVSGTGPFPEWFESKVKKKGKIQVRNSRALLKACGEIPATSARGRRTIIQTGEIRELHSVICYRMENGQSPPQDSKRWIISDSAGFIHVFALGTYEMLLTKLVTLAELLEYLTFREGVVVRWQQEECIPSEDALLGQFILNRDNVKPSEEYAQAAHRLDIARDEFDMSYFFQDFERDIPDFDAKKDDHVEILSEFALLNRTELGDARKRLLKCVKYSTSDDDLFECYRMMSHGTGSCFLFVGFGTQPLGNVENVFMNLALGCKYDTKADRQVAVGVWKEGATFRFRWALIDGPWVWNKKLEKMLKTSNPFKKMTMKVVPRYSVK